MCCITVAVQRRLAAFRVRYGLELAIVEPHRANPAVRVVCEKLNRAILHGVDRHRNVCVCCEKDDWNAYFPSFQFVLKVQAAMPGSLTSRIRQLGPTLRGLDKNSCAVPKDLDCKPTDASSSWRDSRTSLSSSTMNAGGTSCVLIATRLNDNKSQNHKCSNVILSSPIMRQLTTPDRLYRMQHGKPVKPRG
jgi:hypothetical protein